MRGATKEIIDFYILVWSEYKRMQKGYSYYLMVYLFQISHLQIINSNFKIPFFFFCTNITAKNVWLMVR